MVCELHDLASIQDVRERCKAVMSVREPVSPKHAIGTNNICTGCSPLVILVDVLS